MRENFHLKEKASLAASCPQKAYDVVESDAEIEKKRAPGSPFSKAIFDGKKLFMYSRFDSLVFKSIFE